MNLRKKYVLTALAGIALFLLFCNPIGLGIVGTLTAITLLIFPSLPWFVPAVIFWLILCGILYGVFYIGGRIYR